MTETARYDVAILGAGQAGLSLARHLLLDTDKSVLLLERRPEVPPKRQKVGESTVQLAGYYYSKVLGLEEYLLREHTLKYNLRFYWKNAGSDNRAFEDYSKSFIRDFSNIASYQLDRNRLERDLLRLNAADPRFTFQASVKRLEVELADAAPHRLRYESPAGPAEVAATWVVDTSGRRRFLARDRELGRSSPIRHGSFFWWVEGLMDVERLSDRSRRQIRLDRERRATGHLPAWLATNHFVGEGFWFWVIPLQGKTSLGLVYDRRLVDREEVFSVDKATAWICREFPLLARDLPHRKVLDFGGYPDFSYDCAHTIDPGRWALAGDAGRFSDPLYSPGSDLISIHNTLIVDAIGTDDDDELAAKCQLYESLMRSVFAAYLPGYERSYDALGDQETFCLKYAWELAIYFAAYVFPFVNDLFTERRFVLAFLRQLSRLGPLNDTVQGFLSGYFQWKKRSCDPPGHPVYFDFTEVPPLARAQKTFYEVGVSVDEARRILDRQVANMEELARFILARIASVVLGEKRALTHRAFVEGLDPETARFDPADLRRRWRQCRASKARYEWSFDPAVMDRFDTEPIASTAAVAGATAIARQEDSA